MGAFDFQLGVKKETTYGTPVTVDRFFEYENDPFAIQAKAGRTTSQPFRSGSRGRIKSRSVPYARGAEGTLEIDVMTSGFGWWLEFLLGNVATTGAGPYTHTATEGSTSSMFGDSFTLQLNYPFHPSGTNQAFTYAGGKVKKFAFANAVDSHLRASLDVDFKSVATATALATASYPSGMEPLSWTGGAITIGGASVDLDDIKFEIDNAADVERFKIGGVKREPTPGPLSGTVEFSMDFDALTQYDRVHGAAISDLYAEVVGTWSNGTDELVVTVPAMRLDELDIKGNAGAAKQTVKGEIEYDGTNSFVTVAYTSDDATP